MVNAYDVFSTHVAQKTVKLSAKRLVQGWRRFIKVNKQQQHFLRVLMAEWQTIICTFSLQWWVFYPSKKAPFAGHWTRKVGRGGGVCPGVAYTSNFTAVHLTRDPRAITDMPVCYHTTIPNFLFRLAACFLDFSWLRFYRSTDMTHIAVDAVVWFSVPHWM